jgi:hypothetical protein
MLWILSPPKNLTASAGFEPAILGTSGQHANHQTTEAALASAECDDSLPFSGDSSIPCHSQEILPFLAILRRFFHSLPFSGDSFIPCHSQEILPFLFVQCRV